jgi:hypothetical protein
VTGDVFSLEGRVAVVTGGIGQLGQEIVRGLEQRGFEDIQQRVTGLTQFVGGRLVS